jgi:hypothetical protein
MVLSLVADKQKNIANNEPSFQAWVLLSSFSLYQQALL